MTYRSLIDVGGLDTLTVASTALARWDSPIMTSGDTRTDLLRELAARFVTAAQEYIPVRSGRLLTSLSYRITDDGITFQAGESYAVYVLAGVRPQYMTFLLGKTVRFPGKDGIAIRKVTRVGMYDGRRHWYNPGVPSRDFYRLAWESTSVQELARALESFGMPCAIAYLYDIAYRG